MPLSLSLSLSLSLIHSKAHLSEAHHSLQLQSLNLASPSLSLIHSHLISEAISLKLTLISSLKLISLNLAHSLNFGLSSSLCLPPPARLIVNVAATKARRHRPTSRPRPLISLRPTSRQLSLSFCSGRLGFLIWV